MSLDNLKTILNAIKYLLTDYPKKKDIPTKLPNPNPLTFTGAVTGSYDGSEALMVEIPSGSTSVAMRVNGGYIQYSTDNGSTWNNLIAKADLKGDKGDTGATGPQGVQGPQGKQGIQGEPGPAGANGPQGPQGEKGDKGDTGPQGPKGDKGDTGPAGATGSDGQSAYAAAQAGGYTDTEANFYADLAAVQGLASALAAI